MGSGISLCVYEPTHYQSGFSRLSKQHVNVVLTLETIQKNILRKETVSNFRLVDVI